MFFTQYFLKIIVWQAILSLGLGSTTMPSASLISEKKPLAEEAAAEQVGGDQAVLSPFHPAVFKTLPLAANKEGLRPQRNFQPDFNQGLLTAKSALVLDKTSETQLFSLNAEEQRPIGSITKLMTALVVLENKPDWDKIIIMEAEDGNQGRLYLSEGDSATVRDLFYTSLVGSSNNATMALARSAGISLEEFVRKMKAKARQLGLFQTEFTEPTGLDPENKSTAREIALLLKSALAEEAIKEAVLLKNYSFQLKGTNEKRRIVSTDLLLSQGIDKGLIKRINGGKTGFVEEAGYCFVMEAEDKEGHQVIVAVLGSQTHWTRFSEAKALAEWAFRAYEWLEK